MQSILHDIPSGGCHQPIDTAISGLQGDESISVLLVILSLIREVWTGKCLRDLHINLSRAVPKFSLFHVDLASPS